jgi:Tfp pilus assembly protein PilF
MTRGIRLVVLSLVIVAGAGCRKEEVRTGELFQAQSLGLGYLETGQLQEAEAQFKRVIALAPNEPLGYANLGLTYMRASRFSDAERQLNRAREMDPASPDIGLMAAKLYSVTGRAAQAPRFAAQRARSLRTRRTRRVAPNGRRHGRAPLRE